jgi:hypothetical protein
VEINLHSNDFLGGNDRDFGGFFEDGHAIIAPQFLIEIFLTPKLRESTMKKVMTTAALFAMFGLTGCASILNEKTQAVNVSASNGKEIVGTVDGATFKAPGIVNLTRENKNKVFLVTTDGCAKETVAEKSVDGKFFINILTGGTLGSSTDYSTEKMWRYSENVVVSCK